MKVLRAMLESLFPRKRPPSPTELRKPFKAHREDTVRLAGGQAEYDRLRGDQDQTVRAFRRLAGEDEQ